jgi:hypothetical protein
MRTRLGLLVLASLILGGCALLPSSHPDAKARLAAMGIQTGEAYDSPTVSGHEVDEVTMSLRAEYATTPEAVRVEVWLVSLSGPGQPGLGFVPSEHDVAYIGEIQRRDGSSVIFVIDGRDGTVLGVWAFPP